MYYGRGYVTKNENAKGMISSQVNKAQLINKEEQTTYLKSS